MKERGKERRQREREGERVGERWGGGGERHTHRGREGERELKLENFNTQG